MFICIYIYMFICIYIYIYIYIYIFECAFKISDLCCYKPNREFLYPKLYVFTHTIIYVLMYKNKSCMNTCN